MLEREVKNSRAIQEKESRSLVITELASQPYTAAIWALFTWEKNKSLFY